MLKPFGGWSILAVPQEGLALDPSEAEEAKLRRTRHFVLVQSTMVRLAGLPILAVMILLEGMWNHRSGGAGRAAIFLGASLLQTLLTWLLLRRFYRPREPLDLNDLVLAGDAVFQAHAIYQGGGPSSSFWPLMLIPIIVQSHRSPFRCLVAGAAAMLCYVAMLAFVQMEGTAVVWGEEALKFLWFMFFGLFLGLLSQVTDSLRGKVKQAVRMGRELARDLESKAAELEVQRQKAEAASRGKTDFLSHMSHELRTPLNAILLYSELVQDEARERKDTDLMKDMEKIRTAGDHLLALLNQVLDLARIEAGRLELAPEPVGLAGLLEEVRVTATPLVGRNRNHFEIGLDPSVHTCILDPLRMRQCLLNLVGNAAKFTRDGLVALRVDRQGEWLRFQVEDTGIGMTPEQQAKLFQEFVQAEADTSRKYGGSGLGLSLSRHLCRLMGGDLVARSEVGRGSVFTATIPLVEASPPAQPSPHHPRKVLLVDDDADFLAGLARFLEGKGFSVATAASAEEGLEKVRAWAPDVISLDVVLPGLSGLEGLRALKEDPLLADIPVVLLTCADDRAKGLALGASDYLLKPVPPAACAEALLRLAKPVQGRGSLLLVEDNETFLEALSRLLASKGWQVEGHREAESALARLAAGPQPQAIFLDLGLPGMDGFQFLLRLRAEAPWRNVPVLVLTGRDLDQEDRRRLAAEQVRAVLHKGDLPQEEILRALEGLGKGCGP